MQKKLSDKKITKHDAMKKGNMNKKVAPEQDHRVDSYVDLTEEVHIPHFIITCSFFCLLISHYMHFYTG
jgi:hypothetical protein